MRGDIGNVALACVDVIHFKVTDPSPMDPSWNSHKLGGSAVAYEVATNIMTDDIVGYNGPFPAGKWTDINIFRNGTKKMLARGEKVLGDLGYCDNRVITKLDAISLQHSYAMGCARNRHKIVNKKLGNWGVLKLIFRNNRHNHHIYFRSVPVIEQIKFENGNPLFKLMVILILIVFKL